MIVQCPSCASRYRVNEANIPSSGGRIRCPSCQHAFVVYPEPEPSFEDDADDKTSVIMSPNIQEMMANHQKSLKSGPSPAVEHEEESMTEVMDPSEIPALADGNDRKFGAQAAQDDHTVEMTGPLNLAGDLQQFESNSHRIKDDGQTTELTAEALKKGLQAAAAARHLAAKSDAAAPPPMPLPSGPRTARLPTGSQGGTAIPRPPAISQSGPAAARPIQPTPHASPNTLQNLGQRPSQPSSGNLPAVEHKSTPGGRFPSEPVGGRSFGEEPVSRPAVSTPAGLGDTDETGVNMMAPVIISSAPAPEHVGPWHLRTNFGLTYEFPDTKGLRSWLSNRDELDGVTLSTDGKEFFELSHFPQTQMAYATGAMPAVNAGATAAASGPGASAAFNAAPVPGFGGVQRLTSTPFSTADGQPVVSESGFAPGQYNAAPSSDPGSRITPEVYRPPASGSKMGLLLWPVLIVLVAFAVALILQTFEIVDLKSAIFGDEQVASSDARPAQVVQEPEDVPDPQAELLAREAERAREARRRDQFERIVATAKEDIDENRLQVASEKLLTAKALEPNSIAVHEMLVDVYTRLGQTNLAEEASATLSSLREKPLPPADE